MSSTLRQHELVWRRPAPGTERVADGWRWRWTHTVVMAVVNVTPDSFSDGGRTATTDAAVAAARKAWRHGAAVVDVGGVSTRPGAAAIDVELELGRTIGVLRALRRLEPEALLSIDTSTPEVAAAALTEGADLVNDVHGLRDPELRAVVSSAGVPAVVMHMLGEPATMQQDPVYDDVVSEVEAWLLAAAAAAEADGVPSLLLDPGIGFGKTAEHNLALLRATARLASHDRPLLVGASRKRTLGLVTGERVPQRRDPGSLAVHLEVARLGAAMVRAHDVRAHVQALKVQGWLHG